VYRYLRDGSAIDSSLIETKDPLHDNFSHGQLMLDEPVYLITPVELPEAGQADAGPGPADPAGNEADARAAILAGRKSRSWIATGEQCGDLLPDLGRAAGFTPNITMRTHDNVAAQALVAAGLGVALVPGLALRAARPARIRATELPGIKREILALTYPGAADAPAVNRLVEALGRAQVEDS
jgi:DNA-binding transcriptional LysR family regulator